MPWLRWLTPSRHIPEESSTKVHKNPSTSLPHPHEFSQESIERLSLPSKPSLIIRTPGEPILCVRLLRKTEPEAAQQALDAIDLRLEREERLGETVGRLEAEVALLHVYRDDEVRATLARVESGVGYRVEELKAEIASLRRQREDVLEGLASGVEISETVRVLEAEVLSLLFQKEEALSANVEKEEESRDTRKRLEAEIASLQCKEKEHASASTERATRLEETVKELEARLTSFEASYDDEIPGPRLATDCNCIKQAARVDIDEILAAQAPIQHQLRPILGSRKREIKTIATTDEPLLLLNVGETILFLRGPAGADHEIVAAKLQAVERALDGPRMSELSALVADLEHQLKAKGEAIDRERAKARNLLAEKHKQKDRVRALEAERDTESRETQDKMLQLREQYEAQAKAQHDAQLAKVEAEMAAKHAAELQELRAREEKEKKKLGDELDATIKASAEYKTATDRALNQLSAAKKEAIEARDLALLTIAKALRDPALNAMFAELSSEKEAEAARFAD